MFSSLRLQALKREELPLAEKLLHIAPASALSGSSVKPLPTPRRPKSDRRALANAQTKVRPALAWYTPCGAVIAGGACTGVCCQGVPGH